MNITTKYLLSSLLIGSLAVSPAVLAEKTAAAGKAVSSAQTNIDKEQKSTNNKAIKDKQNAQTALLEEVNKGISEGFRKVQEATKLLRDDKEKEAIKALQEATGKFDVALAANPDLGLIPIAAEVQVHELLTTPELVKSQVKLAQTMLNDSKVQAARALLLPLRDDMETRTAYLPMATYPDAIKLATKMLIDKNKDAAQATLATALSTIIEKSSIIPLSVVRAESLINTASELDKEKAKDKALKLVDAAREQLALATVLGYTDKDSDLYDALNDQIKAVKKEIMGGNMVEKLYSKLKASFAELIKRNSEQKTKEKPQSADKASRK